MTCLFRAFLIAGTTLLASACAAPAPEQEPPKPVEKSLRIAAGPVINEYNGASNPVVLRLYQLSDRSAFEAAEFIDIFNETAPELAGVVVAKRSLDPIFPGDTRRVSFDLAPGTFFLAAFAEFADFEVQASKAVIPITEAQVDAGVEVTLSASGVSIWSRPVEADVTEDEAPREEKKGLLAKLLGLVP